MPRTAITTGVKRVAASRTWRSPKRAPATMIASTRRLSRLSTPHFSCSASSWVSKISGSICSATRVLAMPWITGAMNGLARSATITPTVDVARLRSDPAT